MIVFGLQSIVFPPAPPKVKSPVTAQVDEQVRSEKEGIRFVMLGKVDDDCVYMGTDDKTVRKFKLRGWYPGLRLPYPEDGKVVVYKETPVEGKHVEVLVAADLPEGARGKTLGVIRKIPTGLDLVFVNEDELVPGRFMLVNLMDKEFLLETPENPVEEENSMLLKSGDEKLFSWAPKRGEQMNYGAVLKHKVSVKGKPPEWYINRKFMINHYHEKAILRFLSSDANGRMVILDVYLYPEKAALLEGPEPSEKADN